MGILPGSFDGEMLAALAQSAQGIEFSSFEVGISCPDAEKKAEARKKAIDFVSLGMGKKHMADGFDLYFLIDLKKGAVQATPQSVYIEGHYNKFSRHIAQTFHYCFRCKGRGKGCGFCNGTGKLSELSVQEILEKKFLPAFSATWAKFHGAGREDVDVRMFDKGRPFVLEIMEPKKRSADLGALGQSINSLYEGVVAVHDLHFVSRERVAEVKNTEFSKIYSAKCECDADLNQAELDAIVGKELAITQRTPERVEKRRPDIERPKTAKILNAELAHGGNAETRIFRVDVLASHGLYVKEFISGDNGRTTPSVSELLGKKCTCKELDVMEIVLPEKKYPAEICRQGEYLGKLAVGQAETKEI